MRVHYFPEGALSREIPCPLCWIEHKECTLKVCDKPHMNILTDEELVQLTKKRQR